METNELDNLDYTSIHKFSLKDNIYNAKIVNVYDGDTVTAVFKFFDKYYKWSCRLDRIDTPEIKTKNINEKSFALKARDFLQEQILGKIVTLHCKDFDKYGRLLVDIFYNNNHINKIMIDCGYAKEYSGGSKDKWVFTD